MCAMTASTFVSTINCFDGPPGEESSSPIRFASDSLPKFPPSPQGLIVSYADVVVFEARIHGVAPISDLSSRPTCPREASSVIVSNPIRVVLD